MLVHMTGGMIPDSEPETDHLWLLRPQPLTQKHGGYSESPAFPPSYLGGQ